jgi:hypothetical protein
VRRLLAPLLVVALSTGLLSTAPTASAAPPTAAWTGAAQADTLAVDLDVTDGRSASGRANTSQASSGSTRTPDRSTARSANLTASTAGISTTRLSDEADAGPDPGHDDYSRGMAATSMLGMTVGAMTIKGRSDWESDDACVAAGRPLAEATTTTASVSLAPTGTKLVSTGVSTTTGRTELVASGNGESNHGVTSRATGAISDVDVFGARLRITGTTTLSATATGGADGATFEYDPGTITVRAPGRKARTVSPGATRTVTVDRGSRSATVTVKANKPATTLSGAGTSATASVSVLSASVVVTSSGGDRQVLKGTIQLLPLRASAEVPVGGIDCAEAAALDAPVVSQPADGSRTKDTTPTYSGTGVADAALNLTVDGVRQAGVTTVGDDDAWSFTPTEPLARGAHTVEATQTLLDTESAASEPNAFRVYASSDGDGNDDGDGNNGSDGNGNGNNNGSWIQRTLASTGGPSLLVGLAALVLLTAGSATVVASRRRRR